MQKNCVRSLAAAVTQWPGCLEILSHIGAELVGGRAVIDCSCLSLPQMCDSPCFTGFPFLTVQSDPCILLQEILRPRERGLALEPLAPTSHMVMELGLGPNLPPIQPLQTQNDGHTFGTHLLDSPRRTRSCAALSFVSLPFSVLRACVAESQGLAWGHTAELSPRAMGSP